MAINRKAQLLHTSLIASVLVFSGHASGADLNLADEPLFLATSADPNILLAIDDSGSMDFEVLFPTNDGVLWWKNNQSFVGAVAPGQFNFKEDLKYVYLFPNGTGTGNRVTTTRYEIPLFPQYAFARSAVYNKAVYDPTVRYQPWISYGTTTYANIDPAAAPSDPQTGGATMDLTQDIQSDVAEWTFTLRTDMVIPVGTVYALEASSTWQTAATDIPVTADTAYGIKYFPATYFLVTNAGTYTITDDTGATVNGNCNSPNLTHYTYLEKRPGDFSSTAADALGPDGVCLQKVEIKPAVTSYAGGPDRTDCVDPANCTYAEEIQNFANWFSYYRKRHQALRAGMGAAFENISGVRTGLFTINNRVDVTMLDMDTDRNTFFDSVFNIDGNSGSTYNRQALDHAGQQYMRTNAGAPITHSCQRNFTIQFTDGFSGLSGIPTPGNADGAEGAPYQDAYPDSLADNAMRYYKENLRSDITPTGDVPVPAGCSDPTPDPQLDCNANLHMNTYTVGLGNFGTIFGVTHNTVADAYASPPTWPDVNVEKDPTQIDDLYHAAVNGRGEIFNAESSAALGDALKGALQAIVADVGSAASVAFNSGSARAGANVYQARFDGGRWTGELLALGLHDGSGNDGCSSGDPIGTVCPNPVWDASCTLTGGPCPSTNDPTGGSPNLGTPRQIVTYNTNTNAGVPFLWAQLSVSQQASLDLDATASPDSLGSARVDYLRGSRANEQSGGGSFRNRKSLLGDIVHSSPVFVGTPKRRYPPTWQDNLYTAASQPENGVGAQTYQAFKTDYAGRMTMLYAGANDGFLHGLEVGKFDSSGNLVSGTNKGKELLAYMPSSVLAEARFLTYPDYTHRYFVDATPVENDVFFGNKWHTVLVGGLGVGGQGLYALDITNPEDSSKSGPTFDEANAAQLVQWEFTDQNDADLGYTVGEPRIVRLHNGRWGMIVGNGYNSTEPDGAASGAGNAVLFVLDVENGSVLAKLDTGVGTAQDPTAQSRPNGIASVFAVDKDADFITDYVYAGDLFGNIWRFDLIDADPSNWQVADYDGDPSTVGAPVPLFTGVDAGGNAQPITTQVKVGAHPNGINHGVMVYFGTGKYLEAGDELPDTSTTQTFYGIWDKDFFNVGPGIDSLASLSTLQKNGFVRSDLQQQAINAEASANGATFRRVTDNSVSWDTSTTTGVHGWYLDLKLSSGSNEGEMVITDPVIRGRAVIFTTLIPNPNLCEAGGTGFLMVLDRATGGRTKRSPFDVDNNNAFTIDDYLDFDGGGTKHAASGIDITGGTPGLILAGDKDLAVIPQFDGTIGSEALNLGVPVSGRKTWRQLR